MQRPIQWAVGITTVPSRKQTFEVTLRSLGKSGFDRPHLFVDGSDGKDYRIYQLEGTYRNPKVDAQKPLFGPAGNWVLSLYELFWRQPEADFYVIFQDDLVACQNLKTYLEKTLACRKKSKEYWNLFTFPPDLNSKNQPIQSPPPRDRQGREIEGWYRANQRGRGAVGLVFNRMGVLDLLSHRRLTERCLDPHRGHRNIDGGIVTSMNQLGYEERIHHPSLVQHMGSCSSFGNHPHPSAVSWRGEAWDALSLLSQPEGVQK